jgi:transcription elongation factor GreA
VDGSIGLASGTFADPTVPLRTDSGTGVSGNALGAAALLRDIGLMADGPVRWGTPVRVGGPGLYVIELAGPMPDAPLDLAKVGKWLERLPALRLDGERPTSKQLLARLQSLWLPDQTIVYIGMTKVSIGGRVRAYYETPLGDRRPHAGGHWLQTLRSLDDLRVWWARTSAPEEAEDAALDAFAAMAPAHLPARPAGALDLPWANLRRATGERQVHGITGSVLPEEVVPQAPAARVRDLPPGNADGASTETRGTGTVRRGPRQAVKTARAARPASRAATPRPATTRASGKKRFDAPREPVAVTAEALERMRTELDDLTRVRRPEVVARIKAARELGDLRENSEYHAAREEQSFLEGRVRLVEDRLRHAVVMDEPSAASTTGRVVLGSTVRVEQDGDELTFTIVGTTEANPAAGRISTASPVGSALLGAAAGDEVEVRTPRGATRYRVIAVD